MTPRYVAFYGLLMQGYGPFEEMGLADALEPAGPCRLRGRLYDLGGYPGLIAGEGVVEAQLYRIARQSVMRLIDDFEDFDPADPKGSLYIRKVVKLLEPDREAWVYFYNRRPSLGTRIKGGRWTGRTVL